MGWSRIRFKECLQHTIKNLDQKSSQWIHIYVTEQFMCLHRFKWWRRGRIYVSRICIGVTYSDSVRAIENEWWLCIHEVLFRLLFIFYLTYGKKVFSHPYKILSHYLHIHFYLSREEEGELAYITIYLCWIWVWRIPCEEVRSWTLSPCSEWTMF